MSQGKGKMSEVALEVRESVPGGAKACVRSRDVEGWFSVWCLVPQGGLKTEAWDGGLGCCLSSEP